jgi:hypothetical protein
MQKSFIYFMTCKKKSGIQKNKRHAKKKKRGMKKN